MSKRRERPASDPNTRQKHIRIEAVVPLPPSHEKERRMSHPSLISYATGIPPEGMKDMNMRFVRKSHGAANEPDGDSDCELIANRDDREWHARKGHNELNVDYFIGVHNKKTDGIQLFEVAGMYALRPYVRRGARMDFDKNLDSADETRTYAEQRADLLQTFGGRRSQQRVAKYQKDRITYEKVDEKARVQVNAAAKEMIAQDMEQGIDHFKEETTESLAPPHDTNASVPEAAYPLEGLMTPGELAALEQEAKSMIESCGDGEFSLENPGWHPMVWQALVGICSDKQIPEPMRVRRMQAAMHLHYLFVLAKGPKLIKRDTRIAFMESMAVDEMVLNYLLERFTMAQDSEDGRGFVRRKSATTASRLSSYGILMWMTACGFGNCDRVGELAEALGVSTKLLISYAIQLGCKVRKKPGQSGPDAYRLAIKVPLVFPPLRRKKGRPQSRT